MIKNNYNVLGVMSGTSLDGIDLAHISFEKKNEKWSFQILYAETVAYSDGWPDMLKGAIDYSRQQLEELDSGYTALLASVIRKFINDNNINRLDAVCSHGHTILHQPQNGFTLQIGNKPKLAELVKNTVVCNFRVQDVQLGGQGAPLVPIGDRLLFSDYRYCLNLGGFSNISFEEENRRIAFDICPVNTVLNFYANRLGYDYDDKGKIAAGAVVIPDLLNELNALEFYKMPYPKSLGFEFVKMVIIPLMERYEGSAEDKIRTFTEHAALQIANVIKQNGNGSLLITGGGAYNDFLISSLRALLPDALVTVPDDMAIQYKEALIFGLLGVLKLRGDINVLSSVTGARHDHSSGEVYFFK